MNLNLNHHPHHFWIIWNESEEFILKPKSSCGCLKCSNNHIGKTNTKRSLALLFCSAAASSFSPFHQESRGFFRLIFLSRSKSDKKPSWDELNWPWVSLWRWWWSSSSAKISNWAFVLTIRERDQITIYYTIQRECAYHPTLIQLPLELP